MARGGGQAASTPPGCQLPEAGCGEDLGGVRASCSRGFALRLLVSDDSGFMRFNGHAIYDLPNKVSRGQFGGAGRGGRRAALHVRGRWAEPEICPANGQSGCRAPKSSANQSARLALLQILAVFIFVLEIESVVIWRSIFAYRGVLLAGGVGGSSG